MNVEYRKNKATFHAVPPARVRPPPAPLRPLVPAPGVGPPAPRCPPSAGLARTAAGQPALAARRRRLALRGLGAGQAAPLGRRGGTASNALSLRKNALS